MRWLIATLGMVMSGCGSEAAETSVVPGSTCEFLDNRYEVRLDVTFPGSLEASEIIAVTRWANADSSCAPSAPLWGSKVGALPAEASWKDGAVYVRETQQWLIEELASIGVTTECGAALFQSAQIRLDTANDGRGKLMVNCTRQPP